MQVRKTGRVDQLRVDLDEGAYIPLTDLARRLPSHRRGRQVHRSTIHRWRTHGVRGVRLEAVRIGGVWMTSMEAFQRFVAALNQAEAVPGGQRHG